MSEGAITKRPRESKSRLRELLSFQVGGELHALPIDRVREILRVPLLTEVPRAPADVLGIALVRGKVTTVFDLRRKLRLPELPQTDKSRVLIVEMGTETCGLLVDAVLQVHRLREEEIEPTTAFGARLPPYVVGLGRPGSTSAGTEEAGKGSRGSSDLLIVLDAAALLGGS